ncbi:MAG: N-acetylmuramic acid 6-phosphate etherase [Acidobacteria bacterium RIFCSPLOWO2_12_FULL_54_10]|nr:MAG: N-acetylmuramic acid 6-phosphate etherase [Acidobacteria bacterium RIFCSPLOWO2_12_FULL_54_10]
MSARPVVSSLRTEQPNPSSAEIDALDTLGILTTIQKQDATVPAAVALALPEIARAVETVVRAIRRGGRLIYVGAGTSGRIAVMDAAECPPTFGVTPNTVQAVIAGGRTALTEATERTEDDEQQARHDLASRKVGTHDVVIGLAASGRTPYTIAALQFARSRRAVTVAITSNPGSPITRAARISIVVNTGPEVVAGSTRMKAALAQKMVLHMISTASMIRLGHVYRNYMVGVRPTNQKLIARASTIIQSVSGIDETAAEKALQRAGRNVKLAILMLQTGLNRIAAQKLLNRYHGNLRAIP